MQYYYKHRNMRWRIASFIWLFKAMLNNAHKLYQKSNNREIPFKNFLESIAQELIVKVNFVPIQEHRLVKLNKQLRCKISYDKGINSKTLYSCEACKVSMHQYCFENDHARYLSSPTGKVRTKKIAKYQL